MPAEAMIGDPCAWRYFDYPRPGSIYTLPDIPNLVRGPTLVLLPSGKEIKVPAQMKQMVASPAEAHDMKDGQGKMQELMKLLSAKQGPSAPSGFKLHRAPSTRQFGPMVSHMITHEGGDKIVTVVIPRLQTQNQRLTGSDKRRL